MGTQYKMNAITGELELVENLEEINAALERGILKSVDVSGENMIFTFNTPDLAPVTIPLAHFATNLQGHAYIGLATPSTVPITLTGNEKVFYIATEEGDYSNFGLGNISELSVVKSESGSWKAEGLGVALFIKSNSSNAFHIIDNNGNVIATIDKNGLSTTDLKIKDAEGNLKSIFELLSNSNNSIIKRYNDTFYITDNDGNVILKVDKKGLVVSKITSDSVLRNDWQGKVMAVYGDSVVAINNGDFKAPYSALDSKWANHTANYFSFAEQHGRGIGGQRYAWGTEGGAVSWVRPSGVLIARNDSYTYDNFNGEYPSGVTQQMESDGEAIRCRGSLSSWLRITSQFPKEIKDSIDLVIVMAHNDTSSTDIDVQFVSNDTTDTEWANSGSEYYGKINGDYNISCIKGGIASTIMKLQLWMPNAIIVLATGVSGGGLSGSLNLENINQPILLKIAESVREVGKLTSTPVIDTFATDGINGWNRTTYISDSIHPYTAAGGKMLARAVIGGLKTILPKFQYQI